jgi:lysophospholipase L1-like esterase
MVGLPAAATAAVVAIGAQAWYAGHRGLPRFDDLDPSGTVGAEGLPEVRVALIGDSTFTGPGLDSVDDVWIRQVAARLGDRYRVCIRSEAVGGARARDVLMYQVRAAVAWRPDVAVVSVGANDALRSIRIGRFEAELEAIAAALSDVDATVVLAGVGDMAAAPRVPFPLKLVVSERSGAADRAHARVAARDERVFKIPVAELTNDLFRRQPELFCSDLFHPNREGQGVWAKAAYPILADVIAHAATQVPPTNLGVAAGA